jgi:CRISPR-associated protein Cmr4
MEYSLYSVTTKTNTHVGSGQTNAGIVDNIVQRDLVSCRPTIQSSSLKGALKEWLINGLGKQAEAETIFGVEDPNNNKQATHYVFPAVLLSFPMRSNQYFYFNVTCPAIITEFHKLLNTFGISQLDTDLTALAAINPAVKQPVSLENKTDVIIEKHSIKTVGYSGTSYTPAVKKLFGDNAAIMHDDDFIAITKRLPVITRNQLENGKSENLFYEEILPRETYFAFLLGYKKSEKVLFDTEIGANKIFQVGANATVGYGFCELTKNN